MALSKVNFNSINATPTASKFVTFNSDADGLAAGDVGGALTLISTQTASSSASLSFTSGIDSTYKEYVFKFYNIHPATQGDLTFNLSIDGGSNYNVTKTTTFFRASHTEGDGTPEFGYVTSRDLAQSTDFQPILFVVGTDNDSCGSGYLHLFDPSSTTFVKHFVGSTQQTKENTECSNAFLAGYGNTTSAVDAVQFKMASGNIDSGVIKLYGVS
jgi:hypothetical protein